MITVIAFLAIGACPAGAVVDRIEDRSVVVLGASGVRVIARGDLASDRPHGVREGDRVLGWTAGRCRVRAPTTLERDALRDQIGRLTERPASTLPTVSPARVAPRALRQRPDP